MGKQHCIAISRERETALRWFLFQTKLGDRLVTFFERATGLALVPLDSLTGDARAHAGPWVQGSFGALQEEQAISAAEVVAASE